MQNYGNSSILWILPRNALLAELDPKRRSANRQACRIRDLGFVWSRITLFMEIVKIHEISWNFMRFCKITGKARRRGRPKMKKLIWRYTGVHFGW